MDSSTRKNTFIHGFENEVDVAPAFVERHKDLKLLHDALVSELRFLGVFGIRSVGKSRLVRELLTSYITEKAACLMQDETEDSNNDAAKCVDNIPTVIRVDIEQQIDASTIHANVCACLGIKPSTHGPKDEIWINQIVTYLQARHNKQFIFFFDNVEKAEYDCILHEELMALFLELICQCLNVRLLIASTTKFTIPVAKHVYFCYELHPLRPSESAELIRVIAPDVKLGSYETPIIKLSEGLPLLISMIASELADDRGLITPKEMLELLVTSRLKCLSRREFYAREECVADVYKTFLERLDVIYRQRLAVLGFIPGSFDVREAKGVLGYQTDDETQDQALVPIRRHHMLSYDPETRRFNIQGILRECLQVFFIIRNIKDVRKRFCKTFSVVVLEISERLGTEEYVKAMSQFSHEQANFQKLMTEVYNTTEDTYNFFITMATNCTDLMEQFMLSECERFYDGCLLMADRYGNTIDKAMINIAVGSMRTNAKGELQKGAEHYNSALKVLVTKGSCLQLATVYQRLGWNLYRQGRHTQAIGLLQKSLKLANNGGERLQRLAIQSLNSLGLSNTLLGHFDEAERYLFGSLKRSIARYKEDHPCIGFAINNIGEYYDAKGDSENALRYYQEGLDIKKRNKAPPASIVISVTNIANKYSNVGNFQKAHEILDEGLELLQSQKVPSETVLALTYDTKGKVFMDQKRYAEVLAMFDKSAEIGQLVAPENITYVESLVHVAIAKQRLGKHKSCIKTATKAIGLKDEALKVKPQASFMADCYECLCHVYEEAGDDEKHIKTLEFLEDEYLRLEQVHICSCNDSKVKLLRKQLDNVRKRIEILVQDRPSYGQKEHSEVKDPEISESTLYPVSSVKLQSV